MAVDQPRRGQEMVASAVDPPRLAAPPPATNPFAKPRPDDRPPVVVRDELRSQLAHATRRIDAVLGLISAAEQVGRSTVLIENVRKALGHG